MPFLLIPVVIALFMLFAPLTATPAQSQIQDPATTLQIHYTRGGIVQINPTSGATRFVPYRLASEFDRRSLRVS
jgi:hypothetical protein